MTSKPIFEDPVVAEIHAIREKMLAECGGDIRILMLKVAKHQATSGHKIIPIPSRKAKTQSKKNQQKSSPISASN